MLYQVELLAYGRYSPKESRNPYFLFTADLVGRTLTLGPAVLLQLQLGRAFGDTDFRSIIPLAAFRALQPDVLSFAFFLLGHGTRIRLRQ
jgi:hypothetical protein